MKKLIFLFTALLSFVSVDARQINKQEAKMKAQQFFGKANQSYANSKKAPRKAPELVLANNRDELYVFNDNANGGYVIISGDDRMPDVLAYSYDGLYDDNDIPCNMKAWMDGYAEQVVYLRAHPKAKTAKRNVVEREDINPLLTSWFSQWAPYNDKCPEVNGKRCPSGCVATAMAQIMYYHQWPKQTTREIPGYTTSTHGIVRPQLPITTIDWDNICNKYPSGTYSDEQADAVSTLMLLLGTAVSMDYSPEESGAYSDQAANALMDYFDYDESLEMFYRGSNSDRWEEMIYEELKDRRPVYYSGAQDFTTGHAFVMDGYEDGYFHVNWGWGYSYSYVLMTDVGGYNYWQAAIVGIKPAKHEYAVYDNGKMTLYYDAEMVHRSGTVISHKDSWANYANEITECVIDPSYADLRKSTLSRFFDGWSQLKSIEGIENLNTEYVTDMSYMFVGCSSLTSLDLSSFNTDNVKYMQDMFDGCSNLTSLDLSSFNTGNVTYMSFMFYGCSSLASLDLSSFNTDNVKDMQYMFSECPSLTSLDLSSFNTRNVTNTSFMFFRCSSLTSLDLSSFNTGNVKNMSHMFRDCPNLTSLDLSSFNTGNVKDMNGMFSSCSSLKSIYASNEWTINNVTGGIGMFSGCIKLVGGLGTRYDSNHTDYTYAHIDGGESNPGYFRDKNLPDPDLSEPYTVLSNDNTVLTFYFDGQKGSRDGTNVYEREWQSYCGDIISVVFDESFASCTTLTSTASWFKGCRKLTNIMGIDNLKTDNVTNMSYMFFGCFSLTSLDLSSFNIGNVINMSCMFYNCISLTSLDLSSFNTGNVTNMSCMFYGCENLTNLDLSSFDTKKVEIMDEMFSGCSNLVSLDLSSFNTDNVTNMGSMFCYCSSLTSIDLSSFNTDNVTNMGLMFYHCSSLTSLDLSSFNTGNVTGMGPMFSGCSSLTSIDLSGFNTGNVVTMNSMFQDCSSLTSLDLSSFNTGNVATMNYMFDGCFRLASLDLSSFNTDNVIRMDFMFFGCSSLTSLDLSGFNTGNVAYMHSLFRGCSSLTSLDLSSFNTGNVTTMNYMFNGCSSLKSIFVGNDWTTGNVANGTEMFSNCLMLVGGSGTQYDSNHTDHTYAHIDGGSSNPGYFSDKASQPFYTLTYMVDGEVYKTFTVAYGTTITPEDEPTKYGHTFSGWSEIPETMPNHDVIVTGTFYLMGDVNGDGEVDLSDAIMVTYHSLHVAPANFIEAAADINGDGEIDLSDAIIIIYKSLGVK